jgi:hypothetical protein
MAGRSEPRCGVLFGVGGTELPNPPLLLRWGGRMLVPLSSERPLLIGSCIEPCGVFAGVLAGVGGTLPLDPASNEPILARSNFMCPALDSDLGIPSCLNRLSSRLLEAVKRVERIQGVQLF